VYHELLAMMDGHSVSLAVPAALEKLGCDEADNLRAKLEIRSDNGSGYISRSLVACSTSMV